MSVRPLARTPNFDPQSPYTGGWLFVNRPPQAQGQKGAFGDSLVRIHSPGDTFAWTVDVPADDDYQLWLYYGALNAPFGRNDMAGRTSMQVDDAAPVLPRQPTRYRRLATTIAGAEPRP